MKHIEVVAAVICRDGKYFVTRRGYGEFKDYWEFPGGKVEEGESRAEAICRSFKLYTLVEWAAYTKVDIRIETSKNYPLLIGELSQLMFLLPFFSDAARVSFSQVFNEANEDKILVEINAHNRIA